jgi:schlafen family protein
MNNKETELSGDLLVSISDQDLISKLTDTEDHFTERKSVSDKGGWLQTAVAFANSCPIGYPAVLYVGVDSHGVVQRRDRPINIEDLQKSISGVIGNAWPPIYILPRTLKKDEIEFVAVLVPGSPHRPHFYGKSYVRIGPETREASEKQFEDLIAERTSKVYALRKLIGKKILWQSFSPFAGGAEGILEDCNQFFVTIDGGPYKRSFPIDWIDISFDHDKHQHHLIVQSK